MTTPFFAIIGIMIHIYKHRPRRPDEYVGRIDPDNGRIYSERLGPDKYIGRVDYTESQVYAHRPGPDDYLGRVDKSGHIYAHQFGPDAYAARIEADGKLYRHIPHGRDAYLGRLENMRHPVEGAAAFFFFFNEPTATAQHDDKPDTE
jgi:hypothetical protein